MVLMRKDVFERRAAEMRARLLAERESIPTHKAQKEAEPGLYTRLQPEYWSAETRRLVANAAPTAIRADRCQCTAIGLALNS